MKRKFQNVSIPQQVNVLNAAEMESIIGGSFCSSSTYSFISGACFAGVIFFGAAGGIGCAGAQLGYAVYCSSR